MTADLKAAALQAIAALERTAHATEAERLAAAAALRAGLETPSPAEGDELRAAFESYILRGNNNDPKAIERDSVGNYKPHGVHCAWEAVSYFAPKDKWESDAIDALQTNAYAEGRKDETEARTLSRAQELEAYRLWVSQTIYRDEKAQGPMWDAWQARAALSQPQPKGMPEVSADLDPDGDLAIDLGHGKLMFSASLSSTGRLAWAYHDGVGPAVSGTLQAPMPAQAPAPAPEKLLPKELGEWLTAIGDLYIAMGRPPIEALGPALGVVETLREAAKRLAAASPAVGAEQPWQAMLYAPRDGSKIELLVEHREYWIALKAGRADGYRQACEGHWVDFNGGGWSWMGTAGQPIGWRPLGKGEPS